MHPIDWAVVLVFVSWIVYDGLKRTKDSDEIDGYFLANRSIPWWAAGLSVMATQLSAITMIGTTGQGYTDGLRFIQFYFALPLAMIILSVTLVPFFYNSGVYTAYEYLERRFDGKTRSLTSLLFLISRGMSCGAVVSAPAVVLSLVLGWNLTATSLAITMPAVVYTMFGGVQAVTWTDVKIMVLIVFGLFAMIAAAIIGLPPASGIVDGLTIAAATGPAEDLRLLLRPHQPVHVLVGHDRRALPVLLVFRHRSEPGAAIPDRAIGRRGPALAADERVLENPASVPRAPARRPRLRVLHFNQPPLLFNPTQLQRIQGTPGLCRAAERVRRAPSKIGARPPRISPRRAKRTTRRASPRLKTRCGPARRRSSRSTAGPRSRRARRAATARSPTSTTSSRPSFSRKLPVGLVGLLIVAIILAATDTIAGELNSLSTATIIDFYKRRLRPTATDAHYLTVSKIATGLWGLFACAVAVWAADLGSLIEVVNRFGSFFYGSILGVFILAVAFPRSTGNGAFVGLLAGMGTVAWVASFTPIAFLWHNVIGAVTVVVVGSAVSIADRFLRATTPQRQ